jgi:segregation and condensation protein B
MSKELENQIEAILFASGKGVAISEIAKIVNESDKKILVALKNLEKEYSSRDTSLQISTKEDKWKLTVKSRYVEHIEKLVSETELPQPILKTLAIVAFKSPVLQSEIIDIRGQGAYDHINILTKEKLITKDPEGRSFVLKITDKFYQYFDVEGDEEIRDVFEKLRTEQIKKLGELEIVDVEPEIIKMNSAENSNVENVEGLSGLEIVETDGTETNHDEFKKQKNEEKEIQKTFLADIDSQIDQISKRLTEHGDVVPAKKDDEDQEEIKTPLEELNEFADEQGKKDQNKEEDFL